MPKKYPRLRIARANLARFPADVFILPMAALSESRGVAHATLVELGRRHKHPHLVQRVQDELAQKALKAGDAALLDTQLETAKGEPKAEKTIRFVAAHTRGGLQPGTLQKALNEALRVEKEKPTIALPGLGTGVGNAGSEQFAKELAEAWEQVKTTVENRSAVVHVVCWTEGLLSACLDKCERHVLPDGAVTEADNEAGTVDALVDALATRSCFLFVGSGLSFNAVPRKPSWMELFPKERLLDDKKPHLLPDFAQIWEDDEGRAQVTSSFLKEIAREPSVPGLPHYQLLNLPWRAIITTNYDTLIEDALHAMNVKFCVARNDRELSRIPASGALPVVKIHGGIRHPRSVGTSGGADDDIVATRDDYDAFFQKRPGLAAFLEANLLTSTGVSVGHSLEDPHFRALFARIGRVRRSAEETRTEARDLHGVYVLQTDETELARYWRERGVYPIVHGRDDFAGFISSLTARVEVQRRRHLLPEGHISEAQWTKLTKRLSSEQVLTLVVALANAGCAPPFDLLRRERGLDLSALRAHMSPERYAALVGE